MSNSFWLDETLSVSAFRGRDLADTITTASQTLQPIVYCCLEWLFSRVLGFGELGLRLPSVIATALTLWLLFRIGKVTDTATGCLFVASHLSVQAVTIEMVDARPYSFALLAESASLLWMLRWIRSGRFADAALWIAAAVAAIYMHFIFGAAFAVEIIFALLYTRKFQVALFGLAGLVCCTFLVPQALALAKQSHDLSAPLQVAPVIVLQSLMPLILTPAIGVTVLLMVIEGNRAKWTSIDSTLNASPAFRV